MADVLSQLGNGVDTQLSGAVSLSGALDLTKSHWVVVWDHHYFQAPGPTRGGSTCL